MHYAELKLSVSKSCLLYGSAPMTFWKRQNYKNKKKNRSLVARAGGRTMNALQRGTRESVWKEPTVLYFDGSGNYSSICVCQNTAR